ncbi:hypothetical protein RvY_07806 [Ramazzottius varieornatus]|uniref:Thyroglobulin type-1 domain-containing protein n=1 Tax=Ramazzottius varieornatus TaxID=947166 RepID=A0A1D1V9J3_RAMVA|nr:hypothetical protein RvY_07806 [Ramazzottius varieornatus]
MRITTSILLVAFGATVLAKEIPDPVDCAKIKSEAPEGSSWIPQCDLETNQLTPLQKNNAGENFCIDIYTGSILLPPTTSSISCDCLNQKIVASKTAKKPMYIPECNSTTGAYKTTQCNRKKECWCAEAKTGMQLGPRWGRKTSIFSLAGIEDPAKAVTDRDQPRPSCEMLNNFWTTWGNRMWNQRA